MVTLDQAGRAARHLTLLSPPPALCDLAELLWVRRHPDDDPTGAWRIVADDAPHVLWHVSEGRRGRRYRLALVGARTRYVDADTSARRFTVGVRLRPGTIPALFGPAAADFTDRSYTLEEVVGPSARRLAEKLEEVPSEAPLLLAAFLADCAGRGRPVDPRIRWLTGAEADRYASVAAAAGVLGLSSRTLRSLSRANLGIGLAQVRRIRRLHRALHVGLAPNGGTWARVAAEAGYADQAHLIRECRALLGETPPTFAARRDG